MKLNRQQLSALRAAADREATGCQMAASPIVSGLAKSWRDLARAAEAMERALEKAEKKEGPYR